MKNDVSDFSPSQKISRLRKYILYYCQVYLLLWGKSRNDKDLKHLESALNATLICIEYAYQQNKANGKMIYIQLDNNLAYTSFDK